MSSSEVGTVGGVGRDQSESYYFKATKFKIGVLLLHRGDDIIRLKMELEIMLNMSSLDFRICVIMCN